MTVARPGRPPTGTDPFAGFRLSASLLSRVDQLAREENITRSEAIRRLIRRGLASGRKRSANQ